MSTNVCFSGSGAVVRGVRRGRPIRVNKHRVSACRVVSCRVAFFDCILCRVVSCHLCFPCHAFVSRRVMFFFGSKSRHRVVSPLFSCRVVSCFCFVSCFSCRVVSCQLSQSWIVLRNQKTNQKTVLKKRKKL